MGCLYAIRFPSGKQYIGVTKHSAELRLRQHVRYHVKNRDTVLSRAIKKYGTHACQMRVLVVADDTDYLKALEIKAIAAFGTLRPGGYNSTLGGNGVLDPTGASEAIRVQRMRTTMATPAYKEKQRVVQSQIWDGERRAKRAADIAAKWRDPEYRARLVASHSGKTQTQETVQKRIATRKAQREQSNASSS